MYITENNFYYFQVVRKKLKKINLKEHQNINVRMVLITKNLSRSNLFEIF